MKVRRMLAISALGAWFSSPSFAEEASVSASAAAPKMRMQAQFELLPLKMFVAGEVGYQRAFTSTTIEMFGPLVREALDLSYLHVGIGAGTRF